VFVDLVAFGPQERGLGRSVAAVETTLGRQHSPPGEAWRGAEDVGHGLAAARTSQLLGQLAVADQVAGAESGDGVDDLLLEGRGFVVVGPGRAPVREWGGQGMDGIAGRARAVGAQLSAFYGKDQRVAPPGSTVASAVARSGVTR
jgi:hypothetical protein